MKRSFPWPLLAAVVALFAGLIFGVHHNAGQQTQIKLLRSQAEKSVLERCALLEEVNELTCQRDQATEAYHKAASEKALARDQACIAAAIEKSVTKRVVDLPEDGENLHTILFLQPDWEKRPNERKAKSLFESVPWCTDLRSRTHWHVWTIDQPEAKPYWKFVTKTPCLIIQDCQEQGGRILYNEPNPDLAQKPSGLLHQINVTRKRQKHGNVQPFNCPNGVCPNDEKKKPDDSGPKPTDEVKLPPEVKPPEVKPEEKIPMAAAVAIPLIVGALGFVGLSLAMKAKGIAKAARGMRR